MARYPRRQVAVAMLATTLVSGAAGAAVNHALTSKTRTTVVASATGAVAVAQTTRLGVSEIYRRNSAAVVEVDVTTTAAASQSGLPFGGGGGGIQQEQQVQGTGFVYDSSGAIVTNAHVVDGATAISVKFSDGTTSKATLVGADTATDLAVIHVNRPAAALTPVTLGNSAAVQVGDGVVAIGDPFGLDNTVTAGIVSAVGRKITSTDDTPILNAIQTDAAVNHGNSGGPLFDLSGKVIGVTSQIASSSGGNEGVAFAIPSNTVRSVVTRLLASASVTRA
jgi:S1-C subfamily serine protease